MDNNTSDAPPNHPSYINRAFEGEVLTGSSNFAEPAQTPPIADEYDTPSFERTGSTIRLTSREESMEEPTKVEKYPLDYYLERIQGKQDPEYKKYKRNVKSFYKKQDEVVQRVKDFVDRKAAKSGTSPDGEQGPCASALDELQRKQDETSRVVDIFAKTTFSLNIALIIAQAIAIYFSNGSLSIISSLVDCFVDVSTSIIIWITAKKIKKKNYLLYPVGKRRLEPIAIVILSAIMSVAAVELIKESIQSIVDMATKNQAPPTFSAVSLGVMACTIGSKLAVLIACLIVSKVHKSPSIAAISLDLKNDMINNTVVIICFSISSNYQNFSTPNVKYLDPIGAICVAIYIIVSWWLTGIKQAKQLTGRAADPSFTQSITLICLHHHPKIKYIDTVRAYHFGASYLVEVDIVLNRDMQLHEAHDIGESLQKELETIEEIERAFVHLDYEWDHNPKEEHKLL